MQPPAMANWVEQSGVGTMPTLARLLLCSATTVTHGQAQRHGFARAGEPLPMLCRTHSPAAPRHGRGAGARGEGWLPAVPCPVLPAFLPAAWVEVAFFSLLASACQLEYKGIIFL